MEGVEPSSETVAVSAARLEELVNRLEVLGASLGPTLTDVETLRRLTREAQRAAQVLCLVSWRDLREEAQAMALRTAASMDLPCRFEIPEEGPEFPTELRGVVSVFLLNGIRNALFHGGAGRAEPLPVRVSWRIVRSCLQLRLEDEGGGVDRVSVLSRAIAFGLVSSERALELSDREVLDLLLVPGFSTAPAVDEWSGRGMGLDAIAAEALQAEGCLRIEAPRDGGFALELELPLVRVGLQVLPGDLGGVRVLVPADQPWPPGVAPREGESTFRVFRKVDPAWRSLPARGPGSLPGPLAARDELGFASLVDAGLLQSGW